MQKVELVALKRQRFAARVLEPGDEFVATPGEARAVLALGRAKPAEVVPKPKRAYTRRATADKPKRKYTRKAAA